MTTGEVVVRHLAGVEQLLVVYPYVVEGGFTVVARSPDTGLYDAHFGMILTTNPEVCHAGYESTDRRPPQEGENRPMNMGAHCAEPAHPVQRPRRAERPVRCQRAPAAYRAAPGHRLGSGGATYDGDLRWGTRVPRDLSSPGSLAPRTLGGDSWKWLFLQPLMTSRE